MDIYGDPLRSLEIYDSNDLSETLLRDNLRLEQSPNLEIINSKYMTDGVQFYFRF